MNRTKPHTAFGWTTTEGRWRAGAALALAWLLVAPGLKADVRDRRELIARQSQQYRAKHFPDGRMPPKHGWNGQPPLSPPKEVPGGVGYGYYYDDGSLLWTNSTIADYYVIAPTFLGGNVYTLYLTSTCRAQLGTESLIEYYNENEAQFWVFDWSLAASNTPWQVMIDLPTQNRNYLTTRPDEFAVERQMVHVRNGTSYLGFSGGQYNWENQVMLFDFSRGGWDLLYSHGYSTTNLTNNTPTAGAGGYWGPIVETFQTYTNVNPVGFDLIRLFQDGNANPLWLTTNNSYALQSSPWNLLTEASDTSFTVSVGSTNGIGGPYNLGTLCVTANTNAASFSLSPSAGLISPYWIITPNSNRWDKTVVGLPPGAYTISFNNAAGLAAPAQQVFSILSNSITTVQANYEAPGFPSITSQPSGQAVAAGGSATFSVTATGTAPLSYQWYFNGASLSGATSSALTISNVSAGNTGSYSVIVSNSLGSLASASAALAILATSPVGFSNSADWTINTEGLFTTQPNISAGVFHGTDGGGEGVTAWYNDLVYINGFTATFTYQDVGGSAGSNADGTTFDLQESGPGYLGASGGSLAIQGLTPSADFELNLYNPNGIGITYHTDGAAGGYQPTGAVNVSSGDPINFRIQYRPGGAVQETLVDTSTGATFTTNYNIGDITALLGSSNAYVGFSSADGGVASLQTVSNFIFVSSNAPVIVPSPTINASFAPGQGVWLQLSGVPGYPYTLQTATSLAPPINWLAVVTNVAETNGNWQFTDTNALTAPARFYRVIAP